MDVSVDDFPDIVSSYKVKLLTNFIAKNAPLRDPPIKK